MLGLGLVRDFSQIFSFFSEITHKAIGYLSTSEVSSAFWQNILKKKSSKMEMKKETCSVDNLPSNLPLRVILYSCDLPPTGQLQL